MSDPPDPLAPELAVLLDAERDARPSEAALDRVWSRVEHSASGARSSGGRAPGDGGAWLASHGGLAVALAFALGGAMGAGATVLLRRPAERLVYVERPPAPVPQATALAPPTEDHAPAVLGAPSAGVLGVGHAPQRSSIARSALPAPVPSSLLAERAILDRARAALAQNDGALAIELTDEHAQRFARPQLREEREAIAIQALVVDGRYEQARERAKEFRAASPDSLFLPAVDASLASIRDANP